MVSAARQLSMVIPGLFGPARIKQLPEAWQDLSLPGVEAVLARARRVGAVGKGLEQTLFALFQLEADSGGNLPIAAVTRQWEAHDAGDHWWLRADPVHLRADRDRIVMLGNDLLDVSAEECEQLALELNRHFAGEGWSLHAANARRWYLRLDKHPQAGFAALPDVLGQDIHPYMPQGEAERRWRGMMNEAQMVLHASRVNQAREARGALPINSLWFWGGGRLPRAAQVSWTRLWGNDALSRSLASLASVACSSLPSGAAEWLEDDTPGAHVMVMDGLWEKIQFGNVEGWRDFLQGLHDAWLEPLFVALKQGRVTALNLYPADGTVFSISAGDARRWWVRRRPLARWL